MSRPVFASTTFWSDGPTELADVLELLAPLGLDGIELGSTHIWRDDLVQVARRAKGRLFSHNYFPPAPDDLIINLASARDDILQASRRHALHCLDMAAEIGSELYTVHPGFLAEPTSAARQKADGAYDFSFATPSGTTEQGFQTMVESLRLLAEHAARRGIALAIETEGSVTKQGVLLMERPDEYIRLFDLLPDLRINLNVAHSSLAAKVHGFDISQLIELVVPRLAAVELSHNDGHQDKHLPLVADSPMLAPLALIPSSVPVILEFRNASIADMEASIAIIRNLAAGTSC